MRILKLRFGAVLIFFLSCLPLVWAEDFPPQPAIYLNGKEEFPTIQELSGLTTRPLRLLVQRNNKSHGGEFMQPLALGVREGDELMIKADAPAPGERVTFYKIYREPQGARYLSMPVTVYHGEAAEAVYREKIKPFREEFFIVVHERAGSAENKNVHIRYFEERARKLVITSFRTNLMFSSLKFKMKDFAEEDARGFFTENAQALVNRLIQPKRIYMLRLWKIETDSPENLSAAASSPSSIIPIEKSND